jgi:hypothetical protein
MYATVKGTKFEIHEGTPDLDEMQEIVGGYICTALTCESNEREGIDITIFVNDDGLLEGLPINYRRSTDNSPIAGNMVITASSAFDGETIPATESELRHIFKYMQQLDIPITEYSI